MPMFARWVRPALASLVLVAAGAGCSGSGSDGAPRYSVTVDPASLAFTATYGGALPPSRTITATWNGDGLLVGTAPGTSLPPWLWVQQAGSVAGRTSVTVSVTSTWVQPQVWRATLRFVTGKSDGSAYTLVDVPVTYTVADDLALSPAQLAITPNDGTAASRQVQVSLASGGGVAWSATADPGLRLASLSGAAGTPLEVSYDALAQVLPAGTATLNVRVSATISGATVTKTVPVALDVAPHRIYAARNGVALSSLPGVSRLAAAVPLFDNAGTVTGAWSAASDQAWLVVDGTEGDVLSIHADPSSLADGLHFANVTLSSSGPRVEGPDHVRVGLYVSSAAAAQGVLATDAGQGPAPDPIRPWVWLVSPTDRSHVAAFNVYSGVVEQRVTLPAPVSRVAISGDGAVLYGGGMAEANGYTDIARVAIDSGAALESFAARGAPVIATVRPGGREFLLTTGAELYDTATGSATSLSSYGSVFWDPYGWELAGSADQRYLYGITKGSSPTTLARARIRLSGSSEAVSLSDQRSTSLLNELGVAKIAPTPDGSAVTFPDHRSGTGSNPFGLWGPGTADGALVSLGTFVGSTPSDVTRSVDVADDGRVIAVAGYTIDCYDALLGARSNSYALPSAQAAAWYIRFSSDGERAVLTGFADGSTQALWAYPSR